MKAPAFQFYVKDWLSDPELQCVSASSRGMWIDALCYMWGAPDRGKLTGTEQELAKLLRATNGDFAQFIDDLKRHKFADVTMCNNEVTLINRRMQREEKERNNTRLRVSRFRSNADCNANVTPPSPSPSPSPKKTIIVTGIILEEGRFKNIPDSLLEKWSQVAPGIVIPDEIKKAELWIMSNPDKKRSKWTSFLSNWMVRAQNNYVKYGGNGNGKGIRTSRSDPRDPNLQSREDAEVAALNAQYYARKAAKEAAHSQAGGTTRNDDTPNFSG